MRGWGKAPICKAFRLDRRLGIGATCNLAETGKKGRCGGKRRDLRRVQRWEPKLSGLRKNCEKE
jgi:hypothetical protein